MVFSSGEFLFLFLPLTILLYYATRLLRSPLALSNGVLLLTSWAFYLWGSGPLLLLLLAVTAVNWGFGQWIFRARAEGRSTRAAVGLAVAFDLAVLGYFKFSNFAVGEVNGVLEAAALPAIPWTDVLLPIGISFYVFQAITYVVDVARGDAPPAKSPLTFALYIALFPQLIAGPIVRYRVIAAGLAARRHRLEDFAAGALRFTHGLFKKVVVADTVGLAADAAFASPESVSVSLAWIGLLAYTLQIYFDFSGYSDMAIGLGRIFGLRIPENFRRPYSALSVSDFWRRWHITLSTFFRDYVYVPLGGSRGSDASTYRNLVLVFLLTGLWHGASWTFVVWGAYHGVLLLCERLLGGRRFGPSGSWPADLARRAVTAALVMLGWVVFRAESLPDAVAYLGALAGQAGSAPLPDLVDHQLVVILALASTVFVLPRDFVAGLSLEAAATGEGGRPWRLAPAGVYFALGLVAIAAIVSAQAYSPFLYFQF